MFTTRPEPVGTHGMFAFTHWLASSAGLEPDVIEGLSARGHDLEVVDGWSLGRLSAVSRNARDGSLRGAANPRGMQSYAVGR